MLPNTTITVNPDGSSKIEGMEQSSLCHKLSDLGHAAGKVTREDSKDHPPVTQDVHGTR